MENNSFSLNEINLFIEGELFAQVNSTIEKYLLYNRKLTSEEEKRAISESKILIEKYINDFCEDYNVESLKVIEKLNSIIEEALKNEENVKKHKEQYDITKKTLLEIMIKKQEKIIGDEER